LPSIGRDLSASPAALQLLIRRLHALPRGLSAVARRRRFGPGTAPRLSSPAVTLFGAASLWLAACSRDTAQLIAGRAPQGACAALLIPCLAGLIGAAFSRQRTRPATHLAALRHPAAIGPLLGGWIGDHLACQNDLLINPPLPCRTLESPGRICLKASILTRRPASTGWARLLAFRRPGRHAFSLSRLPDTDGADTTTAATLARRRRAGDFVWHECRSQAPYDALGLFRSATFRRVNARLSCSMRAGRLFSCCRRPHLRPWLFATMAAPSSCPSPPSWRGCRAGLGPARSRRRRLPLVGARPHRAASCCRAGRAGDLLCAGFLLPVSSSALGMQ